jgi:hypothetical protein
MVGADTEDSEQLTAGTLVALATANGIAGEWIDPERSGWITVIPRAVLVCRRPPGVYAGEGVMKLVAFLCGLIRVAAFAVAATNPSRGLATNCLITIQRVEPTAR